MAKNATYYLSCLGTLAFGHIAKADMEAPKGASWKPDGKFKGSLVIDGDDAEIEKLTDLCVETLRAEFGNAVPATEELLLPLKAGKGEDHEGKMLISAASQYQPKIYDGAGDLCPKGVFPKSGDTVRFNTSLYPFSKVDKIKERVNGKVVETETTVYGVSLRLASVQIAHRGAGGGGGFGAVEGGYKASADDAQQPHGEEGEGAEKTERRAPNASRDF